MRTTTLLMLGLACVLALGCDEDTTVVPPVDDSFRVEITVVDAIGQPMPGVEATLHIPIPGVGPDAAKSRARTVFEFTMAESAEATFEILDLTGSRVRLLFEGMLAAGAHAITWDARDDTGTPFLGTRVFEGRLTVRNEGSIQYVGTVWPVLYTGFDTQLQPVIGTTDATGFLRVDDRQLFPMLEGAWDLDWTSENGESIGTFQIGVEALIRLRDTATDEVVTTTLAIEDGPNRKTVAWGPSPLQAKAPTGSASFDTDVPIVLPGGYELRKNYPNPFN